MALKCNDCGYDNQDDALMCNLCGRIFRKEKKQTPSSPPPTPPTRAASSRPATTSPSGQARPETIEGLDAWGWHERGLAHLKQNQAEAALQCYDRALAIAPRFTKAWGNKASVFNIMGRNEEALQCARAALSIDPLYMTCWYTKAVIEYAIKQYPRAMRSFSEVLTMPVELDDYAIQQARSAMQSLQKGNVQPAEREALGWAAEGTLRGRQGQFARALPCFDKAIALDSGLAVAWHYKSATLQKLNRHEEALTCDDKAIERDAANPNYWHQRGLTLKNLRRPEEALASYDKALELEKRNPAYWSDRGLVLGILERHEESIASLQQAIALAPKAAAPWLNKALSEETVHRDQDAIQSYQKFVELASRDLQSHIQHATLRIEALKARAGAPSLPLGDGRAASSASEPSAYVAAGVTGVAPGAGEPKRPESPGSLFEKARASEREGRYEDAIDCIDRALAEEPGQAQAWYVRGCSLQQLGELEEAVASFGRTLDLDPRHPEAWYHKGVSEHLLGARKDASRSFEMFLSLASPEEHKPLIADAEHRRKKLAAGAGSS